MTHRFIRSELSVIIIVSMCMPTTVTAGEVNFNGPSASDEPAPARSKAREGSIGKKPRPAHSRKRVARERIYVRHPVYVERDAGGAALGAAIMGGIVGGILGGGFRRRY
jgi:hypothetical protein